MVLSAYIVTGVSFGENRHYYWYQLSNGAKKEA